MSHTERPPEPAETSAKPLRGSLKNPDAFNAMKNDEYRYWQSRPVHERLAAISDLSIEGYRLKGTLPRESGLRGPARPPER